MRVVGMVGGLLLVLAGAVWILQGLDSTLAPRSFMTNDRGWVLYGALAIAAGIGLAAWSWRRRS